jgi:hypothetical protein
MDRQGHSYLVVLPRTIADQKDPVVTRVGGPKTVIPDDPFTIDALTDGLGTVDLTPAYSRRPICTTLFTNNADNPFLDGTVDHRRDQCDLILAQLQ